ncbi:tRNA (adenosine(37)-N6)-threonylcarbamoyltransferase complex ATPase subunit type 1 TsaE [Waterburya agarophytonicola K14]|uniref:tRNA threonylcarbamoyladenosine biosynthesis protein TsaE n=1 Tax=Waterburya agarophytonicola KI4 TaxID=2874699 RepID=A0A964FFK5_9CYAN|nr:tRNA (adenosine(37)-N6)-threonylcarbamoyltransferase complex ATPase subunit type 1 TsaE [Waterburya agarophytonicola]MCC0177041.1 tRNA (adenosine(37)-N6)-threonylcarbamoyltransferase complex ATPase subunit type 1 TsaE [Waterburya agarophytonicola KI4]
MLTLFLNDSLETQRLGYLLGKYLPSGSVIFLSGNLGAGKTTLVQGIGRGLNIEESIVSPTFTLINEYLDGRLPLYHLDLYRLEPIQVDTIYPEIYWEGMEVDPGITAIEWWQRLLLKPSSYLEIDLVTQENSREARIRQQGTENYDLKFIQSLFNSDQK